MIMIYTGAFLVKSHRSDINNVLGVTRIVPTFWPQHLLKLNSNNGPSPGHSNLGSDGRYICLCLLLMVSWWVPSLTSTMAKEVTQIVAPFWPPSVYLCSTRIMAPPQAIPILCQMEYTSVHVSDVWFPGGCHISPRAAGLTSIMV